MKTYPIETFPAYQVTVSMEGSIEEYALNFLKIFNTVRTERSLIRVTNDYGNNVYVVCEEDSLDATKDYLSNFGEVTKTEKVLCAAVAGYIDYDYDKYEDFVLLPYTD